MIGTKLGRYEILAKIGEGGMGEVYRARDPQLDREVAIKVMADQRLDSAEARARFEREAKAIASLSHPNILAIHEFGEHEGKAYAVTELLDGQPLSERLQEGALPLRRALQWAAQMSDGLAAAHEQGVIHRDLKPSNVFLTRDGRIKILDFGLAKTAVAEDDDDTIAATRVEQTTPGAVMGTVRYMSPEQVRGETVDARSDLFSFGVVLWEMLSGRSAFERDSAVETMNAILKEDPVELSSLGPRIPPSVERILHRCLEKSPEQRFQNARDLAFALRNALDSSSHEHAALAVSSAPRRSLWKSVGFACLWLVLGAVIGGIGVTRLRSPARMEPIKVTPLTHSNRDSWPSASPDGSMVAFVSSRDGEARIWLRQMEGGVEAPLTEGTDSAPAFAPDGASVLFLRDEGETLSAYRVSILGGAPRKVLDNVSDVTWSPDGARIAFQRVQGEGSTPEMMVGILEISSGKIRELCRFREQFGYGLDWSPDGKWLACSSASAVLNNTRCLVWLIDPESGERRQAWESLTALSALTWYPDSKHILLAKSTSQLGDTSSSVGRVLRIDPFGGSQRLLFWVQSVWSGSSGDFAVFDFLGPDRVIFDEILWKGSLTRVAIDGNAPYSRGDALTQGNARDRQPAYSPDGRHLIFSSNRSGNLDLWALDLQTEELRQLTDDSADDWDPAYTPDGQHILWSSNRGGHLEIWVANADGSAARQLSQDGEDAENPTQTVDGKWVVYASGNPDKGGIWKMRPDGSDAEQLVKGSLLLPEVSPDGRYVAYLENEIESLRVTLRVVEIESGRAVFSTPVRYSGLRSTVQPGRVRWMPDGQSLVFVSPTSSGSNILVRQDFRPGVDTIASRRPFIELPAGGDIESLGISPDGKSVVVARIGHMRSLKLAEGKME